MSKEGLAGICLQLSGGIREAWGDLTGNDAMAAAGRRERSAGRVRQEGAFERDQAERQLKEFRQHHRNWFF